MKIIVCIKQVPDTTEIKINPDGTLKRDGVPSIMNPDDKAALEFALRLKDEYGAHVSVLSMGPVQAKVMLNEALAMGADEAVLLSDRAFAGSDTWATSTALAGALKSMEYDLILTGRQAIDGDTAQVGPQIAEHLQLPHISYVKQVELKVNIDSGINDIKNVDMLPACLYPAFLDNSNKEKCIEYIKTKNIDDIMKNKFKAISGEIKDRHLQNLYILVNNKLCMASDNGTYKFYDKNEICKAIEKTIK